MEQAERSNELPESSQEQIPPILSCMQGGNADLFLQAIRFYFQPGARIADVTYGKGVFWKKIQEGIYDLVASDLLTGVDFRHLPYAENSFDGFVLDPPYMHGGVTVKKSINDCYHNENTSHESIIALYLGGCLEARRILRKQGILFVKCQDEIESGKQRLSHTELLTILPMIGFRIEDLFVLHSSAIPTMREQYQLHARKNHSYLLVGRLIK